MNKFQQAINSIKSNYPPSHYSMLREGLDLAILVLEEKIKGGWIPVSDRLPEENKDVQITFRELMDCNKKYRYGVCKAIYIKPHSIKAEDMFGESEECSEYDEKEDVYYVQDGWYEVIEHWGDYSHVYINCEVTAWQPLTEEYKGE